MIDKQLIGDFIYAAVHDQPKAADILRQHPELRDARWVHDETALHFLAVEDYTDAVRFLAGLGFHVNAVNEFGDSPLIDVSSLGNDEIAEILLRFGADPNAVSKTRDNVLHCAVQSGNARLVDLLLGAGARAEYVTVIGHTIADALSETQESLEPMLAVLKKHGVEV